MARAHDHPRCPSWCFGNSRALSVSTPWPWMVGGKCHKQGQELVLGVGWCKRCFRPRCRLRKERCCRGSDADSSSSRAARELSRSCHICWAARTWALLSTQV